MTENDFLEANQVRVGKGEHFETIPPIYYGSLIDAFAHYFNANDENKSKLCILSEEGIESHIISQQFTGSDDNIALSILSFHRFFELLIKDILRKIDPLLAVRVAEDEKHIFKLLDRTLEAKDVQTIEYNEAIKRFRRAFIHYPEGSPIYDTVLQKFSFLNTPQATQELGVLTKWRNSIIHNGNSFPNIIAFEYFISQKIIPIVDCVVKAQSDLLQGYIPHFFTTATNVNVINEFLKVKFNYSDFEKSRKSTIKKLLHIFQIKAIGKVSMSQNIMNRIGKDTANPIYESPIVRSEKYAHSESTHENYVRVTTCICCGVQSLVIYRKIKVYEFFKKDNELLQWCRCYYCSYALNQFELLDPFIFGLSKEKLFDDN